MMRDHQMVDPAALQGRVQRHARQVRDVVLTNLFSLVIRRARRRPCATGDCYISVTVGRARLLRC
jgi:hypothetical protein